jgi:HlyD family secretion protein
MRKLIFFSLILLLAVACKSKNDNIKPILSPITESVYAAGVLKSDKQYQAFSTVNGTIQQIYVQEGETVKIGTPILSIKDNIQQLNTQNAIISADYAALSNNQDKLLEVSNLIALQLQKMKNDSLLLQRQLNIWKQGVGTKVQVEQRQLTYAATKVDYKAAVLKYKSLKKQLDFAALQSNKNLQISKKVTEDFTLKSEVNGVLFQLYKKPGEMVNPQTPLALLGEHKKFVLEMQVDEYDIFKIKKGQLVLVTLDSYKGKVFEAKVTTISPLMKEASKTFLVEALFLNPPQTLYPFISFEANIMISTKTNALLIPISYLVNDTTVLKSNGEQLKVKTGLRNYKMVEIISGLKITDELANPIK